MDQTFTISAKLKLLLKIMLPILVTQLAMYLVSFFDVLMTSNYNTDDLAAVSIGASIWMPINLGITGVLMAITPIVAQLIGANKKMAIKDAVQQGFYIAATLSIVFFIAIIFVIPELYRVMPLDAEVTAISKGYLQAMSFGLFPLFVYTILRSFIDALGKTRVTMFVSLLAVPINVVMNYFFIYGHFGIKEFGGVGAGIGSAITYWIILFIAIIISIKNEPFRSFQLFKLFPSIAFKQWVDFLKIGLPIGAAIFIESSIFSVVTLMMSHYSTEIIGAHQIAFNVATMFYMIPLSISLSATIIIGFEVGAKRFHDAAIYSLLAVAMAICCSVVAITLLVVGKEQIAQIYTEDEDVLTYAVQFLLFAAIYQLPDAIQVPIQGALRGYKDVKTTFITAIISYWAIGLPVGYMLAKWSSFGPFSYWIALVTGLTVGAIILALRLWIVQKKYAKNKAVSM